jgi:hypothetical protein
MSAKKLTKLEKEWLHNFQELMDNCPSERFGAYTMGDFEIVIYDKNVFEKHRNEIEKTFMYPVDEVEIHDRVGSKLHTIIMPFQVDGISG